MAEERVQRRLVAILAADVIGYARLMREDETGTRARFNSHLHELIEPAIASRRCHVRDHVVRPSVSHSANLPWDPGRREGMDRRRISDGIVKHRGFTKRRRVPKYSSD